MVGLVGPKEFQDFYDDPSVSADEKHMVRNATPDVQRRFVAGYCIRTNKKVKPNATVAKSTGTKTTGTTARTKIDRSTILGRREATYKNGPVTRIDPKTGERINE
jgi:hypothetical protein